jgi:dihydroorotate dehydrogenase
MAARDRAARFKAVPVLLKIAPDLTLSELDDVVGVAHRRKIDGMIVGNTTVSRPKSLHDKATGQETGGLSGKPLFSLATRMLAETYVRAEGAFPLVGVGGIDSAETALTKFRAGASLVQLYSGLVFRGLGVVAEIKAGLLRAISGKTALDDIVGDDAAAITAQPWPQ